MTYEQQRKLALNAEIAKLRATAAGFRKIALDAQAFAHELELSTRRFQAIVDDDETLNCKIDALDKLAAERRRIHETRSDLSATIVDITRGLGGAS